MKTTIWALALAATALLSAQTQVGTRPIMAASETAPAAGAAGEPLLGFAGEHASKGGAAQGASLYPVLGTASRPRFGSSLALPAGVSKLYLPPLQRYALIEDSADGPLAVWTLRNVAASSDHAAVAVSGAMAHPDLVAFSPGGGAAVLYSATGGRLQVIGGLPAQPHIAHELSTDGRTASALALSDDGLLLVAQFGDPMPFYSREGNSWRALSTGVRPRAWAFLPRTHDLVVSDSGQNEIVLLPGISEAPIAERVLASDAAADQLAATSDGDEIIAASSSTGTVWEIPLVSGARFQRLQLANVRTLSTLRDGHAFLFSSFPNLTLVRATASELHAGH
jgi:hypothetical protein